MIDVITPPRTTLVTGATGLLGSNIVRVLLGLGAEVTALVRDADRARQLLPRSGGLRIIEGDVTRPETYLTALPGCAAVFHTAAYFREYSQPAGPDLDLLERTNVWAVMSLLDTALRSGVPVVVHLSSHGIMAPVPGGTADEKSPLTTKPRNEYIASKIRAEDKVREFRRRNQLRIPVIRPAWMWGPGDAGPTSAGRLFLAVARGTLRFVPRSGNHVVDARDVAEAAVAAAVLGDGEYIVAGTWRTLPDVCGEIVKITGSPLPRSIGPRTAFAVAATLEFQARLRRRPAVASRDGVRAMIEGTHRRVSSARAEQELGVAFRPIQQTLEDEAAWYRERGAL